MFKVMMNGLVIGAIAFLPGPSQAEEPKVDVEWKSCVGVSSIVSTKNACYIVSMKDFGKTFQIELCAGVNVSGGMVLLGGSAKTMLCSTVTVPVGGDQKAARRLAEKALKEKLADPKTLEALKQQTGYSGTIRGVGTVNLKEDPAKAEELRKLLEDIDRAKASGK